MSWNDQSVVDSYSDSADDRDKSWYEDKVTIPSILALLPKERVRVLDFGCGPGNFTAKLAEQFDAAGADSSQLMVRRAQEKHPGVSFFAWDGSEKLPDKHGTF